MSRRSVVVLHRRSRMIAVALGAATLTLVAAVTGTAAAAAPRAEAKLRYVALGDSYAAAPLVPPIDLTNLGCVRSAANYPHAAQQALDAELVDMSCSGAKLEHLTQPQFPVQIPQLAKVDTRTDVVSITIGGNDVDLVGAARACQVRGDDASGPGCAEQFTADGRDELAGRVAAFEPRFGEALDAIRERAPRADIVVVGYGNYVRPGGCFPDQPVRPADADYLQRSVDELSAALERQATRHSAAFVDTKAIGAGHDGCAPGPQRYIEGYRTANPAVPLHPTALGSSVFGTTLARAIRDARG